MTPQPNFLSLPKITFLMNGAPLESAALAATIVREVPRGCIEFFSEPLTTAVVGLYYADSPYDGYIAFDEPTTVAPGSGKTLGYLRERLRSWLEAEEGHAILGKLAARRIEDSYELFSNFILPDAITGYEIEPLMRRFPSECLLILSPSMTVPSVLVDGPIDIMFATPQETLAHLSARKESAA